MLGKLNVIKVKIVASRCFSNWLSCHIKVSTASHHRFNSVSNLIRLNYGPHNVYGFHQIHLIHFYKSPKITNQNTKDPRTLRRN